MESKDIDLDRWIKLNKVDLPELFFKGPGISELSGTDRYLLITLWYKKYFQGEEIISLNAFSKDLKVTEEDILSGITVLVEESFIHIVPCKDGFKYDFQAFISKFLGMEEAAEESLKEIGENIKSNNLAKEYGTLYTLFEGEFSRPLSALEVEFIHDWFEDYQYSIEMIKEALKSSVSVGKLSFKYVDSILRDWHKKGVNSSAENEALKSNFKKKGKAKATPKDSKKPKINNDEYSDTSIFEN